MKKKYFIVVLLCVLLSGCATTAKYQANLDGWMGSSIDDLTSAWGYPSGSFVAPNGNTVYVYESHSSMNMPAQTVTSGNIAPWGSYSGNSTTYGGGTINYYCKTMIEVDKNKEIVDYQFEGNYCVSK